VTTLDAVDFVQKAQGLQALARRHAAHGERTGEVHDEFVAAAASAGLFRMMVAREIGGGEAHPFAMIDAIDTVSRADGAAGWLVMIGATTGLSATQLPLESARTIFGHPNGLTVGVVAPRGRATRVDGGYRVSGVWPFGSGSGHADWITGGAMVFGADGPEMLAENVPHVRMMFFPRADVRIKPTWDVSGLRGTGSNDFEVQDVFVAEEFSYAMGSHQDWAGGSLYRFPFFGLLALGVSAVATGLARGAIEELTSLATTKTPSGSRRLLSERAAVQSGLAEAEALVRSGRALVRETVQEEWTKLERGTRPDLGGRAMIRLAATTAALNAARAVDICYNLGGATSIYAESPLQRHFRDVHTVTQHVMVGQPTLEVAGRVLLGLPTDPSML